MDWNAFWEPVGLSVKISIAASVIVFLVAMAMARWTARARFFGKNGNLKAAGSLCRQLLTKLISHHAIANNNYLHKLRF